MKLRILSEYGPETTPHLEINAQHMTAAMHNFFQLVNKYFEGDNLTWSHSRVEVGYLGKILSIAVRHGINDIGLHRGDKLADEPEDIDTPRLRIEPSYDGSVEMRLDIPKGYRERIDWPQERKTAIAMMSMQVGSGQLRDAIATSANNIISRMRKAGKITDYP